MRVSVFAITNTVIRVNFIVSPKDMDFLGVVFNTIAIEIYNLHNVNNIPLPVFYHTSRYRHSFFQQIRHIIT